MLLNATLNNEHDGRAATAPANGSNTAYRQLINLTLELLRANGPENSTVNLDCLLKQPQLLNDVEQHGLTPLLWQHLRYGHHSYDLPETFIQPIKIATWRHDFAARQRLQAAKEFFNEIEHKLSIKPIALKGFAAAHTLYDSAALRPMADIDVLIPKAQSTEVLRILSGLGYSFDEPPRNRRNIHHHLAVAWRLQNGFRISIECHTDIFSADVEESLSYEQATTQEVTVNNWSFNVLYLEQQWLNLWRHQFEPAIHPALKGYVDMGLLLAKHGDALDWQWVHDNYPTSYRLAQRIAAILDIPLPQLPAVQQDTLTERLPRVANTSVPNTGIPKLAEIRAAPLSRLYDLLVPSRWWLAGRYSAQSNIGRLMQHQLSLLSSLVLRIKN